MEDFAAVLFDLDGVLIDSKDAWYRVVESAARHFCKPDIDRERFDAGWGQGADADVRVFFPGRTLVEVEGYYEQHLLDFGSGVVVKPGAREALLALHEAGVLRGVVTNTPVPLARDLLAWTGLIGLIDVTCGPSRDVNPKPAPDIILRACAELDIAPRSALVVGDSRFDEDAARAAKAGGFVGFGYASARTVSSLDEVVRLVL